MAGVELILSRVLLAVKGLAFKYDACVDVCKHAFACTDILSFVLLSFWQSLKDVEVHRSANSQTPCVTQELIFSGLADRIVISEAVNYETRYTDLHLSCRPEGGVLSIYFPRCWLHR